VKRKGCKSKIKPVHPAAALLPPPLGVSSAGQWIAVVLIVLAGLIVYSNNYNSVFIFDDYDAIVNNHQIQSPASIWSLLWLAAKPTPLFGRPIAALSLGFNYALGGLDVRGYHVVNNLIHLLAALTLFGVIRCTLLLPRFASLFGDRANWYGLVVALLWAVHPLQTETVTYIICRTESLMGFFYLMTLYCAVRGVLSKRSHGWYAASVVACVLGMGSKEVMVSAPLLVLLYDFLFVSGSFRGAFQQRRGLYAALASSWLVLILYHLNLPQNFGVSVDDIHLSVLDYLRTQMTVIVHYLRLAFWPQPLVLDSQDWPIVKSLSSVLIMPIVILGAMVALTLHGLKRATWWAFLGVWFFAILAPTSSLLPLHGEIVSERRMYLPLAAIIVCIVFVVDDLWRRFSDSMAPGRNFLRLVPAGLATLVIIGMGYMAWERNVDYRTEVTIWADTVHKRPANYRAQNNLGEALVREGRFDEAVGLFREATRLKPDYVEAYSNLGSALAALGQVEEAIAAHRKALLLAPDDASAYYNLGNALLRNNDLSGAAGAFKRALALDAVFYMAHGNLGLLLLQQGDLEGAEQHLQRLLQLEPQRAAGYMFLGDLRARQGRLEEAIGLYRQAMVLQPDSQEIADRLAMAYASHDRQ
jgi:Flp pilus assembly protein TadD